MNRPPLIIGHRGASQDAPENTLASFQLAFAQGADGIEADFRLTLDGRIVCMHDATTVRTASVDISIADATLSELKQLDVGSFFGPQWAGEKIPTLEEVLAVIPPGKMIFIEVKCGVEIIPQLKKTVLHSQFSLEKIRFLTFDTVLAGELATMLPEIRVCLNVEYVWEDTAEAWMPPVEGILEMLAHSGAAGLSSKAHPAVEDAFVTAIRRTGRELFVWTVDSPGEMMRYWQLGVDAIMTNKPGFLIAELPHRLERR